MQPAYHIKYRKTTDSPENSLKHLILCSYHHKGSVAIKFCLKRSPYFHFGHRRYEGVFHHVHKGMHLENIMFL